MNSKSQIKRLAIQQGENICLFCGIIFSGEPYGVYLYSGLYDKGPYCSECASKLQANEDSIIGD